MPALRLLAEQQIEKAIEEGLFDNLPGAGKPLPRRLPDGVDPMTEAGFRLMSEAGVLPREVQLKRELVAATAALQEARNADARRAAMEWIAKAELAYNLAMERRR